MKGGRDAKWNETAAMQLVGKLPRITDLRGNAIRQSLSFLAQAGSLEEKRHGLQIVIMDRNAA